MSQVPCAVASMEVPLHAQDAISARNEQQSPLLRLSAELRNQIYTYVFGGLIWEYRPSDDHEEMDLAVRGTRRHLAPLMTCRQVYAEAATMPFSINKFLFQEEVIADFVGALTADQRSAINTVQIKFFWEDRIYILYKNNISIPFRKLPGLKRVEVDIQEEWEEIVCGDWLMSPGYMLTKDEMKGHIKEAVLFGLQRCIRRSLQDSRELALVEDEVKGYIREAVQYGGNANTKRIISFGTDKRDKLQ